MLSINKYLKLNSKTKYKQLHKTKYKLYSKTKYKQLYKPW